MRPKLTFTKTSIALLCSFFVFHSLTAQVKIKPAAQTQIKPGVTQQADKAPTDPASAASLLPIYSLTPENPRIEGKAEFSYYDVNTYGYTTYFGKYDENTKKLRIKGCRSCLVYTSPGVGMTGPAGGSAFDQYYCAGVTIKLLDTVATRYRIEAVVALDTSECSVANRTMQNFYRLSLIDPTGKYRTKLESTKELKGTSNRSVIGFINKKGNGSAYTSQEILASKITLAADWNFFLLSITVTPLN
jgi:hypothetical protein